jgi:hypothetical protein
MPRRKRQQQSADDEERLPQQREEQLPPPAQPHSHHVPLKSITQQVGRPRHAWAAWRVRDRGDSCGDAAHEQCDCCVAPRRPCSQPNLLLLTHGMCRA